MSYAPLNERDDALELGRFLCWPKKKKRLEGCTIMPFFIHLGGKVIGEPLKFVKAYTKQLKILFCIFFGSGLDCILGMVLCHY